MFLYRMQDGVLHGTSNQIIAETFAAGEIKQVDVECSGGYPQYNGKSIVDHGNGEIYYGGDLEEANHITKIDPETAFNIEVLLDKIGL